MAAEGTTCCNVSSDSLSSWELSHIASWSATRRLWTAFQLFLHTHTHTHTLPLWSSASLQKARAFVSEIPSTWPSAFLFPAAARLHCNRARDHTPATHPHHLTETGARSCRTYSPTGRKSATTICLPDLWTTLNLNGCKARYEGRNRVMMNIKINIKINR